MWTQKIIQLEPKPRGFHLITSEILSHLPEIADYKVGMLNLFIQHTSASLTINENADPTVRTDFSNYFDRLVPENESYYRHTDEGSDDLPAHLKSSILGFSINIPIVEGRLCTGIWQGIYLCEHRNHGGRRSVVITINGEQSG